MKTTIDRKILNQLEL